MFFYFNMKITHLKKNILLYYSYQKIWIMARITDIKFSKTNRSYESHVVAVLFHQSKMYYLLQICSKFWLISNYIQVQKILFIILFPTKMYITDFYLFLNIFVIFISQWFNTKHKITFLEYYLKHKYYVFHFRPIIGY